AQPIRAVGFDYKNFFKFSAKAIAADVRLDGPDSRLVACVIGTEQLRKDAVTQKLGQSLKAEPADGTEFQKRQAARGQPGRHPIDSMSQDTIRIERVAVVETRVLNHVVHGGPDFGGGAL